MDWVDRARARKKELGLSFEELAERIGVTAGAVNHWFNRRREPDTLQLFERIAAALGWSLQDLLHGELPTSLRAEHHKLPANIEPGPDIRGYCPLISWVQAGNWCQIVDNFHPGDAEAWYPCPVPCSKATYVLRVRGISMEDRFQDGDLIFVDPARTAENKSFVIVRMDDRDEVTFKQLIIEGDTKYLKPLNPHWPEQIIQVDGNATICGVVVAKMQIF